MGTRMVTLRLDPAHATIEDVQAKYSLAQNEVDATFGVVNVSPEQNLYAILVDERVASRIEGEPDVIGTFSNPKIEPFGPPSTT